MGRYEGPGQYRDGHEDTVFVQLKLDPARLDIQVVEHLGSPGPASDVVHDWSEEHNLLPVSGGTQKKHGRSDPDCHIPFGVTNGRMAIDLGQLGIDQVVEMLLITRHGRLEV